MINLIRLKPYLKKKVKNNNSNSKKIPINNCIYKSNNDFLCYGFFNANSKIMVRILTFDENN